ncbi:hypothetical protein I4U23_022922 [Adineta vaga]|nr:hypothetical protein I4U23_022922 [Adineta vaga]
MIGNDQFWIEILRDYNVDQMLSLPYDRKHISVKSRSNQVWSTTFNFDLKLLQIFRQCTTKLKTTLENLIFTIYYIFLFKITNDDTDFWIGRNFTDKYDHRIPFYLRVDPHLTFIELLNRVTKMSTRTKQHAHVPLLIKSTLFPIVFNFHTVNCDTIEPSIFDLCLTAIYSEESNNLQCQINGSSDIFDHITLQKLSQRFHLLCQQLFISSFDLHTQPIYQLSIILPDEQRLLQQIHNIDTTISNDTSITIPQLFSQQAMKYPHKIAVTLDQASLTYSELFHRAKQLSFTLIDSYNVQSGDIICQCIERSIEMIIGILAIMMSGGIYVPLNPSDSSQRLDSLIQQIKPKLILTHHRSASSSLSHKPGISSVNINEIINRNNECEELPPVSITGESISNIIFTSGSTGVPKGVQIRHRNFVSYMKTQCFDDRDTILQLASCSFDVHLDEILCSLCLGGNLVLLRENGHLDFDYITKVIVDQHVTFIAPVPSWIDALCQYLRANTEANERMRSIRWWFIGGEQLLSSTIQQLLPFVDSECHLLNSYGPAEITEAATCYEICRDDLNEMITIPIGQPLKGYHIYLVDEYRQEVIPNQQEFGIAPHIVTCLQQATISEHAQLLTLAINSSTGLHYQSWTCLHVDHAKVSFAQSRIFLDEQIRFQSWNEEMIAIYNLPLLCRLSKSSLSIEDLRQTLRQITAKHAILRTCVRLDPKTGHLSQYIQPNDIQDWFSFEISIIDDNNELKTIFNHEVINRKLFDIAFGRVFRCHIVRQRSSVVNATDLLSTDDWIIFNFHHIAFDGESERIFLDDFQQLYNHKHQKQDNDKLLQYIDYSIHEQHIDMTAAKMYWRRIFKDYEFKKTTILPVNRNFSSNSISTGEGLIKTMIFESQPHSNLPYQSIIEQLPTKRLNQCNIIQTMFTLDEYQTTKSTSQLNRTSIIEPYSIHYLDENLAQIGIPTNAPAMFDIELSMEYLTKTYSLRTNLSVSNELCDSSTLIKMARQFQLVVEQFSPSTSICDLSIILPEEVIQHEPKTITNSLTGNFNQVSFIYQITDGFLSLDRLRHAVQLVTLKHNLVEVDTVDVLCNPLHPNSSNGYQQKNNNTNLLEKSDTIVFKFHQSVLDILPMKQYSWLSFWDEIMFDYQWKRLFDLASEKHIGDTLTVSSTSSMDLFLAIYYIFLFKLVFNQTDLCVGMPIDNLHKLDLQQAMKYPHKIAVTLDQASLTYSELFHRVKQLSFTLIDSYNVQSGDIICQCIERSIEMIIGILAIMMSGGIYVPLNPSDSSQRLDSLIQQIKPKLILTHHRSSSSSLSNKSDISSVSIDEIINRNNECEELPSVSITGESISNIIFTSGSTGIPKGVQIRHRNFISFIKTHSYDDRDTILQLASCSFDVHLDEILCSLCLGGNLVLLRENGHLDLDYLTKVVADHHVTFITPVPSMIDALCQYLRANTQANERMRSIRWWFIGGEQLFSPTVQQLLPFIGPECHLLNSYGPAEVTEASTIYEICRDDLNEMITIPIGQPLKGYHIYLVDEYRQEVIPNQQEDSSNDSYLCAYVKTRENADTKRIGDELMRMCHNQLPSYMIPSKWMCITEFPLNSNGKVDRQKLSNLSQIVNLPSVYQPIVAPLSCLEKKLEDIFVRAFTLKTSPDILKSFGQLGGTSLGAMHALILIRQEIYEQIDISLLFANPSIRQLASVLEPLLANVKSIEVENEDEKNFSIRPNSSWLIETLGIILLAWQWLWPFYFTSQSNIYMFRLLFIPLIHLFQYLLFVKLLDASSLHGSDSLYSWRYYRLWFLRRQWSLNTYWLGYLFGTRFYNSYLRFCGARISKTACIYTSQIDAPWLIEIGDCSYIGEEVVLSSMSYHDCIYELHQIRIGSHCSIETRSVLHDRVDMHDGIFIAPLTSVTGQILGNDGGDIHLSSETAILKHSIFQLLMILLMISIHALIFEISWYAISCISICWFIWSIVGAIMSLFFLRFVVGHVEEKFSHPLSSWSFLRRFWLRHLVLHSFHPCLSTSFDGFNSFTPFILRWLGATIENNHIEIADFVPLLSIPSNLLTIKSDVTTTSEICFVPYDTTIDGLCIVTGPIEINRRVFLGNNCLLQSGVSIPEDVLIGSLTRIDSTTMILPGDILLGVPAQSMPFILSDVDETRKISNDFPRIVIECIHFILLDLCRFLGSTQWLIFILRQFGAQIGNDVIIDEMNSLYDVHLITIDDHARLSSTCQIQCHTFEHRQLKLRPVKIGSHCILKDMSFVLPGVEFLGYNYLHPCSLALPHDQFKLHTDWSGSPTKRLIVHYGIQPPRFILANRQSSIDNYVVVVARTDDDILILYFGENGWTSWQSGLNLRQPCRPSYIYIRLFFTSFLCNSKPKRILIVGLGGGIWPMLIRHYFPTVIIDVVEIDQTVIDLANEFFGIEEEQTKNNYLNLITDDGYHYVKKTAHRYDMIFIDAFLEDTIPAQINSQQFVLNLHRILNNNGCLITNVNVPSTIDFDRIVQRLTSVFESNILLAHTNTIENARVIISGNQSSLTSISSRTETIQQAERFEIETHLEFSFSHLISLAYHGLINKKIIET